MEKTTMAAKRTGEIVITENPNKRSGYKMATVPFEINGKKAEMVLEEKYKSSYEPNDRAVKMVSWHFVTGDKIIDSAAKIQTDFAMFDIFDIVVDINDILFDAENLFSDLKEKEKTKEKEMLVAQRKTEYDRNYFRTTLKKELEEKGYKVVENVTREEYVDKNRDMTLTVNGTILVSRDYHGWVEVRNGKGAHLEEGVQKTTKSSKTEKIVELVAWAVEADKVRSNRKKEKLKALAGAKENLESILGITMVEKKEYHSVPNGPRGRSTGYETSYFVDAKYKDTYSDGIRFVGSNVQRMVDGKTVYVKGFSIKNMPCITDAAKLKKIYDLLNE